MPVNEFWFLFLSPLRKIRLKETKTLSMNNQREHVVATMTSEVDFMNELEVYLIINVTAMTMAMKPNYSWKSLSSSTKPFVDLFVRRIATNDSSFEKFKHVCS